MAPTHPTQRGRGVAYPPKPSYQTNKKVAAATAIISAAWLLLPWRPLAA